MAKFGNLTVVNCNKKTDDALPNEREAQRKRPTKKVGFIFAKVLDPLSLLWYVVVLTGGTTYEKHDKRTLARKHNSAGGQQKQLEGDEGATRIHGKAS